MAFFVIFWAFVIDQMYSDSNVCMPGCFDSYNVIINHYNNSSTLIFQHTRILKSGIIL